MCYSILPPVPFTLFDILPRSLSALSPSRCLSTLPSQSLFAFSPDLSLFSLRERWERKQRKIEIEQIEIGGERSRGRLEKGGEERDRGRKLTCAWRRRTTAWRRRRREPPRRRTIRGSSSSFVVDRREEFLLFFLFGIDEETTTRLQRGQWASELEEIFLP